MKDLFQKACEVGMNEKEALTRTKTGNFNNGREFDMQLFVPDEECG